MGFHTCQKAIARKIIDSYEEEGKDAINDKLLNVILSPITAEVDGSINLHLYVNISDSHGFLVVNCLLLDYKNHMRYLIFRLYK